MTTKPDATQAERQGLGAIFWLLLLLLGATAAGRRTPNGDGNGNGTPITFPPPTNGGGGGGLPPPRPPPFPPVFPPGTPVQIPPGGVNLEGGGVVTSLLVSFSETSVPFDELGRVAVQFTGTYDGPAKCLQARLTGTDPSLDGLEATSGEIQVTGGNFSITSGNLGWDAFAFPDGITFLLIAELVETDCSNTGTVIGPVAIATEQFQITDTEGPGGPTFPPLGGEFRNIQFAFDNTTQPFDVRGVQRVSITGEYRGPFTFLQTRIGTPDIPALGGLEGISAETPIDASNEFQEFGPISGGGVAWQAFTFDVGEVVNFIGRLVETTGDGNATQFDTSGIIREIDSALNELVIVGQQTPTLENLLFTFAPTTIDDNVANSINLTVSGSYRGPATFIQARLGIDDLAFLGPPIIEAVSLDFAVGPSLTFVPFTTMVTGGLGTPADFFTGPDSRTLLGRVAETTGFGTPGVGDEPGILGTLATAEATLTILAGAPSVVTFRTKNKTPFIPISGFEIQWNVNIAGNAAMDVGLFTWRVRALATANYRICVQNLSMSVFGFFLATPALFEVTIEDLGVNALGPITVLGQTQHLFAVGETFQWNLETSAVLPINSIITTRMTRITPPPITFFSTFATSIGNAASRFTVEQLSP